MAKLTSLVPKEDYVFVSHPVAGMYKLDATGVLFDEFDDHLEFPVKFNIFFLDGKWS